MKNTLLKRAKMLFAPVTLAIAMAVFGPTTTLAAEQFGGHGYGGGHGGGFSGGHSYGGGSHVGHGYYGGHAYGEGFYGGGFGLGFYAAPGATNRSM